MDYARNYPKVLKGLPFKLDGWMDGKKSNILSNYLCFVPLRNKLKLYFINVVHVSISSTLELKDIKITMVSIE